MDEFSYLSVLISVILGLAVTQILKGFRGILLSRTRIRIYWPVIAWAALLLLICVQSWWAMFELRHYQPWTFAAFAVVLLQTILTYMLAGLKIFRRRKGGRHSAGGGTGRSYFPIESVAGSIPESLAVRHLVPLLPWLRPRSAHYNLCVIHN